MTSSSNLANPAATFCTQVGGRYENTQQGLCVIDAWTLYRLAHKETLLDTFPLQIYVPETGTHIQLNSNRSYTTRAGKLKMDSTTFNNLLIMLANTEVRDKYMSGKIDIENTSMTNSVPQVIIKDRSGQTWVFDQRSLSDNLTKSVIEQLKVIR